MNLPVVALGLPNKLVQLREEAGRMNLIACAFSKASMNYDFFEHSNTSLEGSLGKAPGQRVREALNSVHGT